MSGSLFDACRGYVNAQSADVHHHPKPTGILPPSITISREAGAGALTVGHHLVEILSRETPRQVPWAMFDRNLVERVLADHDLPAAIKKFMPEDMGSAFDLTDAVEEMLGLHPSSWTLVEQTTDTILRLAAAGHVIIVGRGSNIITAQMANVLHVRLVAPLQFRIRHLQEFFNLTEREAGIYAKVHDKARARYVRRHFEADINDPCRYHLTINTADTGFEGAARIIAEGVRATATPTHHERHQPA
jgi:cytidylate kinase